jgi:nucleoside-diphosphate-sugar epimerase
MRVLVAGAGGFIGGHLTKRLLDEGYEVRAVDVKPIPKWWQRDAILGNRCLDLSQKNDCRRACEGAEWVFQLAANMGGIGEIETNRIGCMRNALINANMIDAAYNAGVKRYFFSSSACVYPAGKQNATDLPALRESDAYPAQSERGYGWEKLYAEMLCKEYQAERGMDVRIARFHNIYGPHGSWTGGKEKAPAAICRKVAEAVVSGKHDIEIWGDGSQLRSYCWIDDCVEGVLRLMHSQYSDPLNIGSTEAVSVDGLVSIVEQIAGVALNRRYNPDAPKGVAGRNSDNTLIKEILGWEPSTPLITGLRETYAWILEQVKNEQRQ